CVPLRDLSADRAGRGDGGSPDAGGAEMIPFEPERYELQSGPAYSFDLGRRDFFKMLGGGIVIVSIISDALAQESGGGRGRAAGQRAPQEIGAWLHIGEDGAVTVY